MSSKSSHLLILYIYQQIYTHKCDTVYTLYICDITHRCFTKILQLSVVKFWKETQISYYFSTVKFWNQAIKLRQKDIQNDRDFQFHFEIHFYTGLFHRYSMFFPEENVFLLAHNYSRKVMHKTFGVHKCKKVGKLYCILLKVSTILQQGKG